MPRQKTSQAVIKTARLNPRNPMEKRALDYLDEQEAQGFNFKNVIVDAINYRSGATPEMFTRDDNRESARFARLVEHILGRFADELVSKIGSGDVRVPRTKAEDEQSSNGVSALARNFARGVIQRQQIVTGDDDEA